MVQTPLVTHLRTKTGRLVFIGFPLAALIALIIHYRDAIGIKALETHNLASRGWTDTARTYYGTALSPK